MQLTSIRNRPELLVGFLYAYISHAIPAHNASTMMTTTTAIIAPAAARKKEKKKYSKLLSVHQIKNFVKWTKLQCHKQKQIYFRRL